MAPAAEPLEGRVVLTVTVARPAAAVAVAAATDTIGGTADAGSLVEIHVDANGDGALDAGDPVVGSEQLAAGATDFGIAVPLASGAANHFLAVATPPGQGASTPAAVPTIAQDSTAPAAPVVTSPTAPVTVVTPYGALSATPTATITGTAEAGSLIRVYTDDHREGAPDSTTPVFSLQLAAGATDFTVTPPLKLYLASHFVITATDAAGNESTPAAVPTIGDAPEVDGQVFLDRNGDGEPDPGEPGLPGRVVYLDLDGSGTRNGDEPTRTTDAQGQYAFTGYAVGSGAVREEVGGDVTYRSVVNQQLGPGAIFANIAVTPVSPVAPVPIVPNPGGVLQASDPNANYVQALYETVLGREPVAGEVGGWLEAMAGGMSTDEVAARFVNSPEHRTSQVASYYRNFLHRDVDPLAQGWVDDLLSGASEQTVVRGILNSVEYHRSAHLDPETDIRDLYLDVLGRVAGDPEVAAQLGQVPQDPLSPSYADRIVGSAEVNDLIVDSFYANFLRRDRRPDPTSAFWVDRLARGASASAVEVGILSGAEFLAYARSNKGPVFTPG